MTTLDSAPLAPLLRRLFAEAIEQGPAPRQVAAADVSPEEHERMRTSTAEVDYRTLFGLLKNAYMAISPETGSLLYVLARSTGVSQIVEFGTSFGISTLHLAAALRDNGGGRIITTELEPSKAARAQSHFAEGGVDDLVEVRLGDATQTLARDLPAQVDMVMLDGAKPLYPAILALLEPRLRPGALIIADNARRSPAYLSYVRRSDTGYRSVSFHDDVELSARVA